MLARKLLGAKSLVIAKSFVAASGVTTDGVGINASKTITLSATPQANDIILVQTTMGTGVTTSGYTQVGGTYLNSDGYNNRAYYKIASGSEGTNINYNGTDAIAVVIRGATSVSVGSWADGTGTTLSVTPNVSTTSSDAIVVTAIDRNVSTQSLTGYTKVGPGLSSAYFSVNGFYLLSGGSSSALSLSRISSGNSFTAIAFTLT